MRNLDDRALVALFKATSDSEAFGELYRRHASATRGYLQSLGAPLERVDDISQQTFLTAFRKMRQFRGDASFRTWLFTIGYRHHLQQFRREKSETRNSQNLQSRQKSEASGNERGTSESLAISQALERLSEEERSALILCDAYGYTHTEAAEITGRPLGTLKSHVQRARAKAKQILSEENDHE